MVFCSPSTCHVKSRAMVHVMHQSLNDCVLSLWGNDAAKLVVECCFFMTSLPCSSATLFRLLFDRLASLNRITQAYSRDIVPSDYHLFSNLNKFVRLKNFSSDDEAVTTVEDYLTDLNSEFFCKGIQSLHDRWQRVVASEGRYIQ